MEDFNKNDKQKNFNYIRGTITEINFGEQYSSITIEVGHENKRMVNLISKTNQFNNIVSGYKVGEMVFCKFFVSSRFKNEKWYSSVNILSIEKCK